MTELQSFLDARLMSNATAHDSDDVDVLGGGGAGEDDAALRDDALLRSLRAAVSVRKRRRFLFAVRRSQRSTTQSALAAVGGGRLLHVLRLLRSDIYLTRISDDIKCARSLGAMRARTLTLVRSANVRRARTAASQSQQLAARREAASLRSAEASAELVALVRACMVCVTDTSCSRAALRCGFRMPKRMLDCACSNRRWRVRCATRPLCACYQQRRRRRKKVKASSIVRSHQASSFTSRVTSLRSNGTRLVVVGSFVRCALERGFCFFGMN